MPAPLARYFTKKNVMNIIIAGVYHHLNVLYLCSKIPHTVHVHNHDNDLDITLMSLHGSTVSAKEHSSHARDAV